MPGLGDVRAYLWTLTRDKSKDGRPPDEFKIQLILPNQGKGQRDGLNLTGPPQTVLLGYSPDFGVFVAWDARFYSDFGYSRNVQVKEGVLVEARDSGWAVAPPRSIKLGSEVRAAFSPSNLTAFLIAAREADEKKLTGHAREAHYVFCTPSSKLRPVPTDPKQIDRYAARQRRRLAATRMSRDSRFAPAVKETYGHACAICGHQLEVVESAHIIEVQEVGSTDDLSNGIALCPTHHKLFDSHILIVRPSLEVTVNDINVQHLRDNNRANGVDTMVLAHRGHKIMAPAYFATDSAMKAKMEEALRTRQQRSGVA